MPPHTTDPLPAILVTGTVFPDGHVVEGNTVVHSNGGVTFQGDAIYPRTYVKIDGQVQVQGDANIQNFVDIKHAAFIQGDCHVRNFAKINGGAEVWGDAFVHDHAVVRTLNCHGRAHISSGAASGSTYSNMSIDGVFGMHIGRTYHNAQSNPPPPPFASRSTTRMSPYSSPTSEAPAAATGTPEHVNITRGTTIIGRGPDGVTVVCGTMDGHRMEGTVVSDNSTVTFGDFRGSREDGPFG